MREKPLVVRAEHQLARAQPPLMRVVRDRKLVKTGVGVETGARLRLYEGISSCMAAASYRHMSLPNNKATSVFESQIISKLLITPDSQHRMH